MKKLIILLCMLCLVACSKMTRTDLIDYLVDNGYSRNSANFYEKPEDDFVIRIGYRKTITNYLESLKSYITPGPVVLLDYGNNQSFNYHINEDAMLYDVLCYNASGIVSTEIMYDFKTDNVIYGVDDCDFDKSTEPEMIEEFKAKKEIVLGILDKLNLDKKKLDLLGK